MASFWEALPREGLNPTEKKLRNFLLATADMARQLLPRGVPLQQWVERRMATEIMFSKGPNGIDLLRRPLAPSLQQCKAETVPADLRRGQPKESPKVPPDQFQAEAWLDTLPNDQFLDAEEELRGRILELLRAGPLWLPPADGRLQRLMQGILPPGMPVELWVERRIGGEVQLQGGNDGSVPALVLKGQGTPPAPPAPPAEEWSPRLQRSGPPAEARPVPQGKDASWRSTPPPPEHPPPGQWSAPAEERSSWRSAEKRPAPADASWRSAEDSSWRADAPAERPKDTSWRSAEARFLDALPEDDFLDGELAVRDALYEAVSCIRQRHGIESATILQAFKYRAFQEAVSSLIPQGVDVSGWIARRMGGEVKCTPSTSSDGRKDTSLRLLPAGLAELESRAPAKDERATDERAKELLRACKGKGFAKGQEVLRAMAAAGKGKDAGGKGKAPPPPPPADPLSSQAARATQWSEQQDIFFSQLPGDELLEPEDSLRDIVMSHLSSGDWTKLDHIASTPEALEAKRQFLPKDISLLAWIDYRIGGEVETGKFGDKGREAMVRLRGEARPQDAFGDSSAPEGQSTEFKDFFARLPEDEHLSGETELLAALVELIRGWPGPGAPTTKAAGSDPNVQAAKKSLGLPRRVSLASWIDRRIGGEVSTTREMIAGKEEVVLGIRGSEEVLLERPRDRHGRDPASEGKGPAPGGPSDRGRERNANDQVPQRKADQFFASLGEQLSPGEEELRDALLDVVGSTTDALAPSIHSIKRGPGHEAMNAAMEKVFQPCDRSIGLLLWMQRRIASDIEVMRISPSSGTGRAFCYFGIPGTLDEASLQRECDELAAQGGGPKKRARHRSKGPRPSVNPSNDAGHAEHPTQRGGKHNAGKGDRY